MKKALLIASALLIAVVTTACINNIAVQELNNKAAEYMAKGDYEAAVNRLQASIDLDSTMFETYYNLGIAATNAKKYDVAIEALENGIKVKSDFANFYYSLAVVQAEKAEGLSENNEDKDNDAKKEIFEENKNKISELKASAKANAQKYLELAPQAEDKEEVEEFIKNIDKEEKEEQPKVLEG